MRLARLGAVILTAALLGFTASPAAAESTPVVDDTAERICSARPFPTERGVFRISGTDRYSTAIAVSRAAYGDRQGCAVAVASGRVFPDAITAAANISFGPLLLIPGNTLPSAVRNEINRLDPTMIDTYGGPGVIAPNVSSQLAALAGGMLTSNSGANRYGTAGVATYKYLAGTPVYIASGLDYPDALAAARLIRQENAAFMLVTPTSIPAETRLALGYLKPSRIVIVGGTGSVSSSVARALDNYTSGSVTRITGADRFETAVAIARVLEPTGAGSYTVVSGRSFPDALSSTTLGAGPVLLVEPDSIPPSVQELLREFPPARITIIGGQGTVSDAVAAELETYISYD